jgi:hypothetical protein
MTQHAGRKIPSGFPAAKPAIAAASMLLFLLAAANATAQQQNGAIAGVVKDSTGSVLPGVTVEASGPLPWTDPGCNSRARLSPPRSS